MDKMNAGRDQNVLPKKEIQVDRAHDKDYLLRELMNRPESISNDDWIKSNEKRRCNGELDRFRKTLPASEKEEEIVGELIYEICQLIFSLLLIIPMYYDVALGLVNKNQVIVVTGETGCGKTTQVR